jgi:hypothetical protein
MNPAAPSAADAPPAAPAKLPFSTHWTLVLLLLVYMMSFIDRQIMGILMEPIKREFQVSDTAMGLLSGLTFALFYSALAVPFSRYADRANRRNMVAWCCAAWSAMTALCGLAGSYWTLALARVGVAVGEAGGTAAVAVDGGRPLSARPPWPGHGCLLAGASAGHPVRPDAGGLDRAPLRLARGLHLDGVCRVWRWRCCCAMPGWSRSAVAWESAHSSAKPERGDRIRWAPCCATCGNRRPSCASPMAGF